MVYLKTMKYACLLLIALFLSSPASAQEGAAFPTDHLTIVGANGARHGFEVELALTPQQQTQGLMFRRALKADSGMLFDFHAVKSVSMWMKNTLLPLDMIFIADDGRIAGIAERTIPQSLDIISSPGAVRAVLEVNGGTVSRLGLKAGDRVDYGLFSSAK